MSFRQAINTRYITDDICAIFSGASEKREVYYNNNDALIWEQMKEMLRGEWDDDGD